MATAIQSGVLSDLLRSESPDNYCRETYLAEGAVTVGMILKNGTNPVTQKKPVVLTAVNQVVTVTTTGTTSAGSFVLGFPQANGSVIETGPIAYNASVANVQTALDAALGADLIIAGGTIAALTLTYSGEGYAALLWPLPTVTMSGVTASSKVLVALTTAGAAAMAGANAVALTAAATGKAFVALVRGPAVVNKTGLTYAAEATDAQALATDAVLTAATGILVR
jgi:hypothetical protein